MRRYWAGGPAGSPFGAAGHTQPISAAGPAAVKASPTGPSGAGCEAVALTAAGSRRYASLGLLEVAWRAERVGAGSCAMAHASEDGRVWWARLRETRAERLRG